MVIDGTQKQRDLASLGGLDAALREQGLFVICI